MRSTGRRLALLGGVAASVLFATTALASAPASTAAPVQRGERLAPLPPIDIPFTKFTLSNGLTGQQTGGGDRLGHVQIGAR